LLLILVLLILLILLLRRRRRLQQAQRILEMLERLRLIVEDRLEIDAGLLRLLLRLGQRLGDALHRADREAHLLLGVGARLGMLGRLSLRLCLPLGSALLL